MALVPPHTHPRHEHNQYATSEDAVKKTGDTMTGNLTFPEWSGPQWPTGRITEVGGGQVSVIDNGTGDLKTLRVADPTQADNAATKSYADTKVNKTGDTMTGNLSIDRSAQSASSSIRVIFNQNYSGYIYMYDGNNNTGWVLQAASGGSGLGFHRLFDLGGSPAIDSAKATLNVNGTLSLSGTPSAATHAATKGYIDAMDLGGVYGNAASRTGGERLAMRFGYAGVPTGGDVSISWSSAGFTAVPHLITHIIGYADANTGWSVSSTTVTTTGTTLYVRKNNSGASAGGSAVLWIAIGPVA